MMQLFSSFLVFSICWRSIIWVYVEIGVNCYLDSCLYWVYIWSLTKLSRHDDSFPRLTCLLRNCFDEYNISLSDIHCQFNLKSAWNQSLPLHLEKWRENLYSEWLTDLPRQFCSGGWSFLSVFESFCISVFGSFARPSGQHNLERAAWMITLIQ